MSKSVSFEWLARRFTSGGTGYLDAGQGSCVVFIHGVGMNSGIWLPQLSHFADRCRVVAYDVFGHGDSPMPPDDMTLKDLDAQLLELLDECDISTVQLVGHSMGALIATHFALTHPDRVQTLIALNPVYARDRDQRAAVLRRADLLDKNEGSRFIDATLQRWFGSRANDPRNEGLRLARNALRAVDQQGYRRIYRLFATADQLLAGRLHELPMRALFVTGALDPNSTPAMAQRMAAEAPRGVAQVIQGARHMMAIAQPRLVNRVIAEGLFGDESDDPAIVDSSENSGNRSAPMADQQIDTKRLREALGTFMTGVTVITTVDEADRPRGFTANAFTSVSLDPPLILICVDNRAASYSIYKTTQHFAVNILSEQQREISGVFAGKSADKFEQVEWTFSALNNPVITGGLSLIDCRVHERFEAGDHLVVIGEVCDFQSSPANPLGFFSGAYVTPAPEQEALPDAGQTLCVGAILERDGQVLLLREKDGLYLPRGRRLGSGDDPASLKAKLLALGVSAEIGFVYAVYEQTARNVHHVYYRGQIREDSRASPSVVYAPLDEIPWDEIADSATRSMLERYARERIEDRFGVYVGDFEAGQVHALGA
jgi:flavin reductase (DIM6/NTAB) family NADH-FMN oxidoreductase RutF/pimeloyl-ACP methyl ester carboxylesterase